MFVNVRCCALRCRRAVFMEGFVRFVCNLAFKDARAIVFLNVLYVQCSKFNVFVSVSCVPVCECSTLNL